MLKAFIIEFLHFGFKQAWACLFGGLMLALLILTHYFYPADALLKRYDFLVIAALLIQLALYHFKLESLEELKVIFIFHIVGTIMEIFKTHMGSWIYPEDNLLRIGGVPLFSGFMYGCVGSYIARSWKIFDYKFKHYPPIWLTVILAVMIYINFFTHHYIYDIRYFLFVFSAVLYGKAVIYYKSYQKHRPMPMLLSFILVSLFIWFAENIGTFTSAWIYPNQRDGWELVSISKLGSWYLLMLISGILVSLVHRPQPISDDKPVAF